MKNFNVNFRIELFDEAPLIERSDGNFVNLCLENGRCALIDVKDLNLELLTKLEKGDQLCIGYVYGILNADQIAFMLYKKGEKTEILFNRLYNLF